LISSYLEAVMLAYRALLVQRPDLARRQGRW
jgi:hypothetical protein